MFKKRGIEILSKMKDLKIMIVILKLWSVLFFLGKHSNKTMFWSLIEYLSKLSVPCGNRSSWKNSTSYFSLWVRKDKQMLQYVTDALSSLRATLICQYISAWSEVYITSVAVPSLPSMCGDRRGKFFSSKS